MEAQMMSSSLGAMGSLLGKLHTQLISPEHQLPKSLKNGIAHLKQDLEELNSFLVDLSRLEGPNAMVKRWMNEVRELSYDMEDYIDNTMSSNMMASRQMNKEILSVVKKFRNLVKQARERHERYELWSWASNSFCLADGQDLPSTVKGKATELVGIGESKGELIKWLKPFIGNIGEAGGRLKVVSILGPAGVGKSTLAQEVYREIGGQFERRAFVRASRVPDARRLLRSMISQVQRHQRPPCGLPVQELVDNLRTHLQQKRYFVVIDGLWETTSWDIIKSVFPEGGRCSRVLITTDILEVALECCDYQSNASVTWAPECMLDSDYHFDAQVGIFKMEPLSTDDSMELFFNRVFGSNPKFSEQLTKHSEEIIKKCSGLPLATIIIASVFACQPDNSELWSHIKERLFSRNNLSSEDLLKEIIGLSYYSLSQQLKTCLLYLSLYPEGYTFLKTDLVKQWTAEGFISAVEGKCANEVSECYFDELVSRGLVQPNINFADEVMFYTVHSSIFEVIRRKSIEDNFTTVIDYSETAPMLSAKVRRLSLSFSNAKYVAKPEGFTLLPVRSLTFYGLVECLPSIMGFKLLRVLNLEFWGDRKEFDLSGIYILFQLRYVRVTTDVIIKLPVKMRELKYLETLEIYANILTVPSDIVNLPKLLHLHLQEDIKLPDYVGHLRSLRTLQSFDLSSNSEENVQSLGEMTNLHGLHISCSTALSGRLERNLIALASSIGKLGNLKSLTLAPGVSCTSIYTDCSNIVSSPPIFLEKFELLPPICIFSKLPEWIGQLQKLCILKIVVRELRRDDINKIAGLQELTVLSLYVRQPTAESIIFNSTAFPVLKYLTFRCGVLRLAFQAEAIPNLRRLRLEFNAHRGEQYVNMLAGIEHLLNLQEVAVRIGEAPGADESDKMAAESLLKDTISKHSRHLSFSIQRADSFDEEIPKFSYPAASASSSYLEVIFRSSTTADIIAQRREIDEVQEVSLYRETNDPVIRTDQAPPIEPLDSQLSLDDLDVIKVIGKGSSGNVQLVRHKFTGQFFALKVIQLNIEASICKQIAKELKISLSTQCQYIVVFYQCFYFNGAISIVLEYMDGGSLSDFLKTVKTIPEDYLAAICKQILKGLIYLHHERRIIHRGLKPSNILINHRGGVKISDFGISAIISSSSGQRDTFIGTRNYMAPERINGKKHGYMSDIWSLGLVILECATGNFPFPPCDSFYELLVAVVDQPPPSASSDQFSPEFCSFISACIQKDAKDRSSAQALLDHPYLSMYDDLHVDLSSYFRTAGSPLATFNSRQL